MPSCTLVIIPLAVMMIRKTPFLCSSNSNYINFSLFYYFSGKYLLVRDPNKAQLRLYALPSGNVADDADSIGELDEDVLGGRADDGEE